MSGPAKAGQNVILIMALVCALVCVSRPAFSTTYYVSCTGNDANNGTSTSTPWATLSKASSQAYAPGDTSLASYYYDSYQSRAWTTYFTVQ